MGKTTKTVRLSEEELRILCEQAVDRGVKKFMKEQAKQEKRKQSRLLHNTRVLLENYRKLKMYLENTSGKLDDIIQEEFPEYSIQALDIFGLRIDDRKSYTIARGVATTTIIMQHVDKMLDVYRRDCENSPSVVKQRRWQIVERLYLRDERMNAREIAEEMGLDIRAVQKDAKHAREELKVLIFGIDDLFREELEAEGE